MSWLPKSYSLKLLINDVQNHSKVLGLVLDEMVNDFFHPQLLCNSSWES